MGVSASTSLSQLKLPELKSDSLAQEVTLKDYSKRYLSAAISSTILQRRSALINDLNSFSQSIMLATAHGDQLDQVSALLGVKRLQLAPADPTASPPKAAIMEEDERLRLRAKLSMHALNQSGCEGSYRFYALSASACVKDVSVYSDELRGQTARINVVILSDQGRGDHELEGGQVLEAVRLAVKASASITDHVITRWASIFEYKVDAKLDVDETYNEAEVIASATKAVCELIRLKHRLGQNIIRDEFLATLYQPGVNQVLLIEPSRDWAIANDCAPYNPGVMGDKNLFKIEVLQQIALETEVELSTTVRAASRLHLASEGFDHD